MQNYFEFRLINSSVNVGVTIIVISSNSSNTATSCKQLERLQGEFTLGIQFTGRQLLQTADRWTLSSSMNRLTDRAPQAFRID
jgi:hypothetical protein